MEYTQSQRATDPALQPHQPRRTLEDVKRVGAEIIASKGFRETSIRDIADALGITKSAIYHHVESKNWLLHEIISSYEARGRVLIEAARRAGPDPEASLRAFIRELVLASAQDLVMATLLARELRSLQETYRKTACAFLDETEAFVRHIIMSGQAAGVFREDIDARLATIAVFSMVNSLHLWFRHDGTFDASKVARDFERILIGGLLVDADPRSAEVPFHGETSTAHFRYEA